jgi:hypothetical protein
VDWTTTHFLSVRFASIRILLSPSENILRSMGIDMDFKCAAIKFPNSNDEGPGNITTSFKTLKNNFRILKTLIKQIEL